MESNIKRIAVFSLLMGIATAVGAQRMGGQGMMGGQGAMGGQTGSSGSMMGAEPSGAARMGAREMTGEGAGALVEGEIRRVDKGAKKVTIRHGAIAKMDMPPMTMVYQVKDAAILDQVKAGDKVRFAADNIDGVFVVTKIEAMR